MEKRTRPANGFYKSLEDNCCPKTSKRSTYQPVLGYFEVEEIIAKKIINGRTSYYVKWTDYPSSQNIWEIESHIPWCLRQKFEKNTDVNSEIIDDARLRLADLIERGLKVPLQTSDSLLVRQKAIRSLIPRMPSDLRPRSGYKASKEEFIDAGLKLICLDRLRWEELLSVSTSQLH